MENSVLRTELTNFRHHPWARAVELLGSWDNFAEPYRMERDDRKGEGHWTGCHSFKDIICDGDLSELPSPKRSGGLKQGGTYWYYVCFYHQSFRKSGLISASRSIESLVSKSITTQPNLRQLLVPFYQDRP